MTKKLSCKGAGVVKLNKMISDAAHAILVIMISLIIMHAQTVDLHSTQPSPAPTSLHEQYDAKTHLIIGDGGRGG
jgi:hypothetical protein